MRERSSSSRKRARPVVGRHRADVSASDLAPTLTASEIGAYAFCPRAWYLQRHGVGQAPEAERRRRAGRHHHRALGRRTDLVRAVAVVRRALLVVIVAAAALVAILALRGPA